MKPITMICFAEKAMKIYEDCCLPVCRAHGMNQTAFDVMMFLYNNPEYNTARNICEIRGLKSGIASVAIEYLAKNGYLERTADSHDRRKQRLLLTGKAVEAAQDGREAQKRFYEILSSGISPDEMRLYEEIMERMAVNVMETAVKRKENKK